MASEILNMSKIYYDPEVTRPTPVRVNLGIQGEAFWALDCYKTGVCLLRSSVYSTSLLDYTLGIIDCDVYLNKTTNTYTTAEVIHNLNCIFINITTGFLQTGEEEGED